MIQFPPDAEKGSLDARVYLEGSTALPESPLDGNVLYVASLVFPVIGMHSGGANAVRRAKNLLEARFPSAVTQIAYEDTHYEVRYNGWPEGGCLVCTSLATYAVTIGSSVVVVELRQSVHYA